MRNPLSDKIVTIKPSGIRKFFDIVSEMLVNRILIHHGASGRKAYMPLRRVEPITPVIRDF